MDGVRLKEAGEKSLVISFEGRISRDNSKEVEEELMKLRQENRQEQLVFDFENLSYISSAGLRVLLNMAKGEKNKIQIFNISVMIYDILGDVGFLRMFDAHKALKQFTMDGFELIGQGANGAVYRVDRENVIKVFQNTTPIEDIERERDLAQQALLSGISTAISYSVVKVDDCFGIMFELIDAVPLSITLKSKPDEYDHYTDLYIELYKKIHESEGDPEYFNYIKDLYHGWIDSCSEYYSEEEIQKFHELVKSVPDRDTLIHGDYHPNNIMVKDGELMLIDMGDMSIGHPIFDFLATASTQVNLPKLSPEYAEIHTKMPVALIEKTWRRLFDSYFAGYSKEDRDRIEEQISVFSKLKVALAPVFGRGADPAIIKASIDDAKANFLPKIDTLIGSVDW
ncbi:MAG: phosphotransferase [Lachnospiraceae bacterium]|nr:phosphotransferase [Lachnospiraceae bacterium]